MNEFKKECGVGYYWCNTDKVCKPIEDKISEHIVKSGSGYKLLSKKTGKNLGTASSLEGIKKREREVQYFKHMHEDGAVPTINISSGNIAVAGVGKDGEPGVKKKKLYPFITYMRRKGVVT